MHGFCLMGQETWNNNNHNQSKKKKNRILNFVLNSNNLILKDSIYCFLNLSLRILKILLSIFETSGGDFKRVLVTHSDTYTDTDTDADTDADTDTHTKIRTLLAIINKRHYRTIDLGFFLLPGTWLW